ncbi:MAG: FAD binding domain-containing protein, partial [Anaerolineae bacterium]
MLRLPPFEYLAPRTLDEAVTMLGEHGPAAMLVAGGTDLFPNMKRRLFEPAKLVGLRGVAELQTFEANGGVTLGAGLTLAQICAHPLIVQRYPALATAAGLVSTPQLRHMGTIGGNLCLDTRCNYYNQTEFWRQAIGYCMKKEGDICLVAPGGARCWAVNSSDTAPVMVALGASVRLVGPQGARTIPAHNLYHDDGMRYLTKAPDEILTAIHLPDPAGLKMAYLKLRRRGSFDFPVLGVAVTLRLAEDGICTEAGIVLGAVASRPIKADRAEAMLV